MDLAEKIKVNVFALGHTYKELLNMLGETDPGNDPRNNGNLALHLEPLVEKFCKKLEFGPWDMMRVASDATLLLKRMNRDWMVQGRSPAGIIGACIILAARMNNYRRTVREVVYVVRVADSTLNQRLHEFKRTDASNVSVQRFRKEGVDLRYTIAPPAVYKREAKEYKKRKRAALDAGLVWDSDKGTATGSPVPSPQNTTPPKPSKSRKKQKTNKGTALSTPPATQSQSQLRQDAEGFAIPPVPSQIGAIMDPESHEHQSLLVAEHGSSQDEEIDEVPAQPELPAQSKKRGRPRNEPIVVTDEERKKEEEIEAEIKRTMEYWQTVFLEFRENPNHPILVKTRNRALKMVSDYMPAPSDYANENDAELDADPDVANCKNSPEEVALKEKIWITENEEWLRRQQQKILRKELEEASGKKKVVRRRRHHQLGDGSLLEGRPAATAAEAARVMNDQLAKNRGFSGAIDYEALYSITRPGQPNAGESPDDPSLGTPSATAGASPASGQAAQQKDKDKTVEVVDEEDYGEDEDAEGDWDEAYEEQPGGGFMDPTLYAPIVEETPLDDEDALDNWT
jgi:transcription factor IIIB subunit 2